MYLLRGWFLNIYFILLIFLPSVGTDSFQDVISIDFRGSSTNCHLVEHCYTNTEVPFFTSTVHTERRKYAKES